MTNNEYLDSLPFGSDYNPPERIVCSGTKFIIKDGSEVIIASIRHWDKIASELVKNFSPIAKYNILDESETEEIQGFITSKYRFVDRNEAWNIAVDNRQIVRRVGGDNSKGGTLYSENLY